MFARFYTILRVLNLVQYSSTIRIQYKYILLFLIFFMLINITLIYDVIILNIIFLIIRSKFCKNINKKKLLVLQILTFLSRGVDFLFIDRAKICDFGPKIRTQRQPLSSKMVLLSTFCLETNDFPKSWCSGLTPT